MNDRSVKKELADLCKYSETEWSTSTQGYAL